MQEANHTGQYGAQGALEAIVEEALPRAMFRVRTEDGFSLLASLPIQASQVIVRILPGDRVLVRPMERNPSRGRIEKKLSHRKR